MRSDPMAGFHPLIRDWFSERIGVPSPPQVKGWPAIAAGDHTLILAPTGTGKTLAAFLWELNALIVEGQKTALPNAVQILYISPLKALGNDIHRNLERPLAELAERFADADEPFPEIRVAVRSGDTTPSARARMLRVTPHILITTPESLNILLTTERGRTLFPGVRAVIVDEIHAVAGTKRGVHLALTLERLDALCSAQGAERPQRIGLSATQRPLDEIARYLGGCEPPGHDAVGNEPRYRAVTVVDCGLVKPMELEVRSPVPDLGKVDGSVWPAVTTLALDAIRQARTTLVFVNNRGTSEKMAARLNALAGEQIARPYHGSLSRERRLELEHGLKAGELPALVSTSSLELGIDIGAVDLVLQLQSPKRVATALQRVGRAGHSLNDVSRGVLVPTFRDDLVECAAVAAAMMAGEVEATVVPQNPLDVLAQSLVAIASAEETTADAAFALVRQAYPYHRLTREAFDETLAMLAGKYPSDIAAELEPRLTWDRVTGRVAGSRASRMTAIISGGTIPDRGLYTVNLPDRTRVGELDEEFVHESRVGDVFQLGSATWRLSAIEHDRVVVIPAPGAPARMPFWHGEFMSRSVDLSRRVGQLRRALAPDGATDETLRTQYRCDDASVVSLRAYVAEQRLATGIVPDDRTLVVEHFRDEMGAVRVIIHSIFGGRVNAPWGMALAQRTRELLGTSAEVQVQTSDDGIMLRMPDLGSVPPLHALFDLTTADVERRVVDEVGDSALFGARFRMNAGRALLLPRGSPRRRMPLWLQRLKAADLLQTVRQFPSFPILVETYREVMQDAFDLTALTEVVESVATRKLPIHIVETDRPSPFAVGLQFGFVMDWLYADDTPRAERAAARLAIDQGMLADLLGRPGAPADEATEQALADLVAERQGTALKRRARDADELAHLLERLGDLSLEEMRARTASPEMRRSTVDPVDALISSGRAVECFVNGPDHPSRFVSREALPHYLEAIAGDRSARRDILRRFLGLAGPRTVQEIHDRYPWPTRWIEVQLLRWQRAGKLIRGSFRRGVEGEEWCSTTLLERARRRALAALRAEIQATDRATFAAFLQRWQHVDPRDRLSGEDGVARALQQLAGFARPAGAWERDYLPARISGYDGAWLSRLAGGGSIVWAATPRYTAAPQPEAPERGADGAAAVASGYTESLAGVRFFARGTGALWLSADGAPPLSDGAIAVREELAHHGASFLSDLEASAVASGGSSTPGGLSPLALRDALRELVAAGVVTNDTIEALREVIRTRALPVRRRRALPDPTRWLPAAYTPSAGRIVQRRATATRLPRWRRPDQPGATSPSAWTGRWSLVGTAGTLGPSRPEEEHAAAVAHQWLERYGVVTRDWWRRERPPVSWQSIYRELKRLEYRGEVRRGYFVEGLGGAQFALPEAVERLRAARDDVGAPFVVMATSDPANIYSLPHSRLGPAPEPDPLRRPRGAGAILVTRRGAVILSAEGRGRRLRLAPGLNDDELFGALSAIAQYLVLGERADHRRPRTLETIDDGPAAATPRIAIFRRAGFRMGGAGGGMGLEWGNAVAPR